MDRDEHVRWLGREILPHEPDVRRWLAAHVRGRAGLDIDDVIQEAYARLWGVDPSHINDPRAYFFTTARNLVGEVLRRARIVPIEMIGDIDALNIVSSEVDAERRLTGRDELKRFMAVLEKLPKRCREAFELRKFEDMSQRQIAGRMGIAESTVEKHLTKALRLVMDGMKEAAPEDLPTAELNEYDEQRETLRD